MSPPSNSTAVSDHEIQWTSLSKRHRWLVAPVAAWSSAWETRPEASDDRRLEPGRCSLDASLNQRCHIAPSQTRWMGEGGERGGEGGRNGKYNIIYLYCKVTFLCMWQILRICQNGLLDKFIIMWFLFNMRPSSLCTVAYYYGEIKIYAVQICDLRLSRTIHTSINFMNKFVTLRYFYTLLIDRQGHA